jgi:queuine tRNA-ribosyltransferase
MAGEILALRLITLHNVHFYCELVKTARVKILSGEFTQWKKEMLAAMSKDREEDK